ncbi:hypothetical protein [Companilactobacillus keshanensis]|uniref:DNA-binding protein n=1 Tax=Companilactobacillus keshanensis TaxID=2486003 RepID=A0ABW4BSK9_9LACO|nr:hypothetical protein [Companilactobacillus keshanensis]
MLGLFLLLTLEFTAFSFVPFVIALLRNPHKLGIQTHIFIQLAIFFIGLFIVYFTGPDQTWKMILQANLVVLAIASGLHGSALAISKRELKKIEGNFLLTMVGSLVALGIVILVIIVSGYATTKSVAKITDVTENTTTKNAPMPLINSKSKEVPVVNSYKTVRNQMQNSLSNVPDSNVYSLNHARVQFYHGKLVYIAPLDFDGSFFRYNHYKKVPGYFIVDATSKNSKPKFVKKSMRYTPSAYFGHDASRKIYASITGRGLVLSGSAPQLEINESGHPYYVQTLYKQYGLSTRKNYRKVYVAVLDSVTGKVQVYKQGDEPKWIDVTFDPNIASDKIYSFAAERNGWWNAHGFGGSRLGVMKSVEGVGTEGRDDVFTPIAYKKDIYYFTSMTSNNSKQTSVLGYMYVNAKTGKTYYYREEADAMTPNRADSLAENRMKQTQWKANMPLLYRIDGKPTWVVSMIDDNGAFMSYVYLLANGNGTQDTVAVGTDAKSALQKYRNLFNSNTDTASSSHSGKKQNFTGTVNRVVKVNNGEVAFLLNDNKNVFYASIKNYPRNMFIQNGDEISFSGYLDGKTVIVDKAITNKNL